MICPSGSHLSLRLPRNLLWPLFFYTQWAIPTSRKLSWGWYLRCEYHYTQLKPNCIIRMIELRKYVFSHVTKTYASEMSDHHLKSEKKTDVSFTDFFFIFFMYFLWNLGLWFLSGNRGFLPVGVGSAQRCKSGLSGTSASQNPEFWLVTERMRSQTQAAQMSFQVLLN